MRRISADAAEQDIARREVIAIELESAVARHQWIVLIPQTEICGEFVGHAITIADVEADLPLLRGSLDKLLALAHSVLQSEQELRPGSELIGIGAAV